MVEGRTSMPGNKGMEEVCYFFGRREGPKLITNGSAEMSLGSPEKNIELRGIALNIIVPPMPKQNGSGGGTMERFYFSDKLAAK